MDQLVNAQTLTKALWNIFFIMTKKNKIEIFSVNLLNVNYEFALLLTQLIIKYAINIIKEQSVRFGPNFIQLKIVLLLIYGL